MIIIGLILLSLAFFITYKLALAKFKSNNIKLPKNSDYYHKGKKNNHHKAVYFAYYISLWAFIPAFTIYIFCNYFLSKIATNKIINPHLSNLNSLQSEIVTDHIIQLASNKITKSKIFDTSYFPLESKIEIASSYSSYLLFYNIINIILALVISSFLTLLLINIAKKRVIHFQKRFEGMVKFVLLIFTSIAVVTTIGIVLSLFFETLLFFKDVSLFKFLFGTKWKPENSSFDLENSFGILPLLSGTLLISFIAVTIAVLIGVSSAVYMAEYMPKKLRRIIKPILEILSGIPSIVYGFFAAITFTPILVGFFQNVFGLTISSENALNAGIIMGIMIIPFLSSIADDVLNSIPSSIREGAMGLGSMKGEMICKILLPAAMPGIMGGVLLAMSRAIGETMIVVMASSLAANLTFNPLEPVTTITTQIVLLLQGDQEFNSPKTLSAFALGFTLLIITLIINIIAIKIVSKYKKQYG